MKNAEIMSKTVETALQVLREGHALTPVDPGKYRTVKVNGLMKFHVEQYALEGVGSVSVMRMKLGPMAMATVVAAPYEKNAPLMSVDYIFMMGNRKAYIEFYDLVAGKDEQYLEQLGRVAAVSERYAALESISPSPAWYDHLLTAKVYKAGKAADDETLLALLEDHARAWMDMCDALPALDEAAQTEKRRITREYSDGLVDRGGISTDVFKKSLGEETTRDFFGKVFFGTEKR